MTTITALAIDPQAEKLACYGEDTYRNDLDAMQGFIFVLDPSTGIAISELMSITHTDAPYDVKSAGLVIRESGIVYWAENSVGTTPPNSYEQRIRIGAYDSANNSVVYHREIEHIFGVSASLVHGTSGSNYDHLYVGASYEDFTHQRWHMAILKIDHHAASPTTPEMAVLVYTGDSNGSCSTSELGSADITQAVYVDKLGFMEDGLSGGQLFGVTRTNNHAGT